MDLETWDIPGNTAVSNNQAFGQIPSEEKSDIDLPGIDLSWIDGFVQANAAPPNATQMEMGPRQAGSAAIKASASVKKIMEADGQLQKLMNALYERCVALGNYRGYVQQERDRTTYELDCYQKKRDRMCESQLAFMQELETLFQHLGPEQQTAAVRLKGLHQILCRDHHDVITQTWDVRKAEIRISEMEVELQSEENKLGRAVRRVVKYLNMESCVTGDEIKTPAGSIISQHDPMSLQEQTDNVHPLTDDYNFKVITREMMCERVVTLQEIFQEDRVRRNFQVDQGLQVDDTDEDFEKFQRVAMETAVENFVQAASAESNAREACQREGLMSTIEPKLSFDEAHLPGNETRAIILPSPVSKTSLKDMKMHRNSRSMSELRTGDGAISSQSASAYTGLSRFELLPHTRESTLDPIHSDSTVEKWLFKLPSCKDDFENPLAPDANEIGSIAETQNSSVNMRFTPVDRIEQANAFADMTDGAFHAADAIDEPAQTELCETNHIFPVPHPHESDKMRQRPESLSESQRSSARLRGAPPKAFAIVKSNPQI